MQVYDETVIQTSILLYCRLRKSLYFEKWNLVDHIHTVYFQCTLEVLNNGWHENA